MLLALAALLWGCAPDTAPPAPVPPTSPATTPTTATVGPLVTGAWVRAVPPNARMTAGYLKIYNPGPEELVIVGAESPLFGSVEMHGTVTVDGMARMRQHDTITVPAGEAVSFEPGGLHLMLMQAVDDIPSSGTVEMTLLLEGGERLEFLAPVGQPGG
jgi:copper(I)-binding protein